MLTSDELNQLNDGFNKFLEDLKFLSTIDIRIYIGIFAAALTVIWGFGISKGGTIPGKREFPAQKKQDMLLKQSRLTAEFSTTAKTPATTPQPIFTV